MCDRVVADATHVFWTTRSGEAPFAAGAGGDTGRILACPVGGCPQGPLLIAQNQSHVDALAVDREFVYWTLLGYHGVASSIVKCPRTGCVGEPTTVYAHTSDGRPSGGGPRALAVESGIVFWADADDRTIKSCPSDGCGHTPPTILARLATPPRELTAAQGAVYWTNDEGSVMKCDTHGCNGGPTVVGASEGAGGDIVTDDAFVYWLVHHFGSEDGGGAHHATILRCPIAGCIGAPAVLFTTPGAIAALASDGTNVYWANRGGAERDLIMKCARERCLPTPVAQVGADHLAVSAAGVFWGDERSHQIQALARE